MKKYKIQIQDSARGDIQEAVDYYEGQSKGLGRRFVAHINDTSNILKLNSHFQIKYDEVRCLKIRSFPYALHYTIIEDKSCVIIQAVIHTASDPAKAWLWKDE